MIHITIESTPELFASTVLAAAQDDLNHAEDKKGYHGVTFFWNLYGSHLRVQWLSVGSLMAVQANCGMELRRALKGEERVQDVFERIVGDEFLNDDRFDVFQGTVAWLA